MATLTFHFVTSDPVRAAKWYASVLGAQELSRLTLPDGNVLIIDLQFGDSQVAISGELPDHGIVSPLTLGGTYGAVHIEVEDVDAVWERALAAGAKSFQPLQDAFWGERTGQFIDPFGHRWAVAHRVREVPHDELLRLAAQAYGSG